MKKTTLMICILLVCITMAVTAVPAAADTGMEPEPAASHLSVSFDNNANGLTQWATSAYIAQNPDKMVYKVGESFDPKGMKVYVTWTRQDGTTKEQIISNSTLSVSPDKFTKEGKITVKLTTDGLVRQNGKYVPFSVYLTVEVTASGISAAKEHVNQTTPVIDKPVIKVFYTGDTQKWVTVGASKKFQLSDGTYLTGWQAVDGRRYYFNEECVLQTGWFQDSSGQWYCAYSNGQMYDGVLGEYCIDYGRWLINDVYNVHYSAEGMYWVLGDDGRRVTKDGWYDAPNGDRFYIRDGYGANGWIDGVYVEHGKMFRNTSVYLWDGSKNGYYVFDGKGKNITTPGWFADDNGQWYYIGKDGLGYTGWIGNQYISGGKLASGLVFTDQGAALFDAGGRQTGIPTGWIGTDSGYYFFLEDGSPYTGWLTGGRYCEEGKVLQDVYTNMIEPNTEDVYYFNKDGLVPGGWTQDVWGDWHYYTSDGSTYTGWLGDMYIYGSWLIKAEIEGEYIEETIDGVKYRIDSNGHAKRISR